MIVRLEGTLETVVKYPNKEKKNKDGTSYNSWGRLVQVACRQPGRKSEFVQVYYSGKVGAPDDISGRLDGLKPGEPFAVDIIVKTDGDAMFFPVRPESGGDPMFAGPAKK